jgi:hypothetical protein
MPYAPDQIEDFWHRFDEMQISFAALRERFVMFRFQTQGAREHADQGFSRRLGTLVRCVERVFELLPPDLVDVPERDEAVDATINIQAFVFNAFGCCENLALIWVFEKDVRLPNNRPLPPKMVGLGERYERVRESFTPELRDFLDARRDWFLHLTNFRDALAHRIPLYIPPYVVPDGDVAAYQALSVAANDALRRGDIDEFDRLQAEQKALARFEPIMTHSFTEQAPVVSFHDHLFSDFNTIKEIANKMLDSL